MSKQHKLIVEMYEFIDLQVGKIREESSRVSSNLDSIQAKKKKANGEEYKRLCSQELELNILSTELLDAILALSSFLLELKSNEVDRLSTREILDL